jgi:hypothetical protein
MQKINLHQKKLIAILEAAFAMIALLLPWTKYKVGQTLNMYDMYGMGGMAGGGGIEPDNGFRSWGWLVLLGVVGVVVWSLLRDQTKDYDKQTKAGALASFGAITVGAIAYLITLNGTGTLQDMQGRQVTVAAGMGLWSALVAGVVGLLWVSGLMEQFAAKNKSIPPSAPPTAPTPPAPPAATA